MKTSDREIAGLKAQLEECNIQISFLAIKHQAAAEVALRFSQEIEMLRSKYDDTKLRLRDLEDRKNGTYLWENIGYGG